MNMERCASVWRRAIKSLLELKRLFGFLEDRYRKGKRGCIHCSSQGHCCRHGTVGEDRQTDPEVLKGVVCLTKVGYGGIEVESCWRWHKFQRFFIS